MDPFPDSIHYTNSAFSLLQGKGYVVEREGLTIPVDVPLLYPLTLIPSFAIFTDVRAFYFTNVFLSISAFLLFYRIVKISFPKKRVQLLVLLSYLFFLPLSWYSTLAMAENLILPLFLLALNLMIDKFTLKKSLLMAVVCISFYATKYASIPLLFAFALLYFLKIWSDSKEKVLKSVLFFIASLGVLMLSFEAFEYMNKGSGIITQLLPLFMRVFVTQENSKALGTTAPQNLFFSTEFIARNLNSYVRWLLGEKITVLWTQTRIMSALWAVPSMIALVFALSQKKWRWLAGSLCMSLIAVLGFMMSFYTTDGRYFWNAIPTVFLGFGFFLSCLDEFLKKKFTYLVSAAVFLCIGVILLLQNLLPLKSAVMLNLRHAETPWPYISILRINDYLKTNRSTVKKPVIISPLSPYYIDYFRTENMLILPLHEKQEARSKDQRHTYGDYDFTNLHQVYKDLINQGMLVYFASYGIGNDNDLKLSEQELKTDFVLKRVDTGCLNACNLYQLEIKN